MFDGSQKHFARDQVASRTLRYLAPFAIFLLALVSKLSEVRRSLHSYLTSLSTVQSWCKQRELLLLLLSQLAHHPIKDNGRGRSLLRAPSIPPGKAATDIVDFMELMGKGNITIKIDFKKHRQGRPLRTQLIQSGWSKGCTTLKVPEILRDAIAYIQFDLNNTLLHFQPVKVSLGVPLQGLSLNIVLFLDWCRSVSALKAGLPPTNYGQGHQPAAQIFVQSLG